MLPPALRSSADHAAHGDVLTELEAFLDAGIDGFSTDQPDLGRVAVDAHAVAEAA